MILNDKQILRLCQENQLLDPYVNHSVKTKLICPKEIHCESQVEYEKIISYGLSSYGYDLRLADEFKVFYPKQTVDPKYGIHGSPSTAVTITDPYHTIDPKKELNFYTEKDRGYVVIPAGSFALGRSIEYIKMPRNITGLATNKSTYARCGLNTPSTVLEAGWEGHLTIEMFNSTPHPIKVYSNEGIIQVLFFQGEDCLTSYSDRDGKYQGQKGVTGAKV